MSTDYDRAADSFEPRLARAVRKALAKIRSGVSVGDLAAALAAGSEKRALAALKRSFVEDALKPAGNIKGDAVIRGGKIGAKQIKGRRRK